MSKNFNKENNDNSASRYIDRSMGREMSLFIEIVDHAPIADTDPSSLLQPPGPKKALVKSSTQSKLKPITKSNLESLDKKPRVDSETDYVPLQSYLMPPNGLDPIAEQMYIKEKNPD
jgi:hypothetical protein